MCVPWSIQLELLRSHSPSRSLLKKEFLTTMGGSSKPAICLESCSDVLRLGIIHRCIICSPSSHHELLTEGCCRQVAPRASCQICSQFYNYRLPQLLTELLAPLFHTHLLPLAHPCSKLPGPLLGMFMGLHEGGCL